LVQRAGFDEYFEDDLTFELRNNGNSGY